MDNKINHQTLVRKPGEDEQAMGGSRFGHGEEETAFCETGFAIVARLDVITSLGSAGT